MVYGRGSLCVDLGYEAIVNVCEGELVTPGQNPECFNSDGTPATKKVFIIVASACSGSGGDGYGSPSHGDTSPGTSDGPGSGGGGTPNPNPSNPTTTTPEPNPNNPGEPVTVIGGVITSPTLPSPTGFKTFFSGLNLQQQEWLNLPENINVKNDMKEYLEQNSYSDLAQNYTESLIEEIMTNTDDDDWSTDIILLDYTGPEITNITEYLECFDTNQRAIFTIYADQPVHGDNDSWSGNPTDPDVGHTFISIKQGNIRRVIGFYPSDGVNPFSSNPSTSSALINDSGHSFDSSISLDISSTKLQNIINYITSYPATYNLNSYNCTDFGMSISKLAGLKIPSAHGNWPGGSGDNPGQLGQNIRNMPLPTGVIAIKNTTGGVSHSNEGTCN